VNPAGSGGGGRLRVLLLGSFPPQTQGIAGYCAGLATALAGLVEVEALGFRAMYPPWLFPGEKRAMDPTAAAPSAPGLRVRHALAWYNPLGWLWHAWKTPAQVVHLQWWSLPLFPVCLAFAWAARRRGLPLVLTAHNVLPHERSRGFLWASRRLYRRADHIVVHSETNRSQLLETFGLDPARVTCVPMGATPPMTAPPSRAEALRVLDLPPERPTLLFFGIIRPYKGLDVLLHALATVRERHPEVLLIVAGKAWASWKPCADLIDTMGLARNAEVRLGYIPESDVARYFAAADLVVLPYTHFDAQSAVGAQALGHGKALLVTDTGGLPELVKGDPRWCVPPRDPAALAGAICNFLDAPDAAKRAFATEVGGHTGWGESAAQHAGIYHQLSGFE